MALLAGLCLGTWAADPAPAVPESAPAEQLRLAEGLMSRNFLELAQQELEGFAARYPDHELAPKATLMLAECLRLQGKTDAAIAQVDRFRERWPQHEKAPSAALLKGELLVTKKDLAGAQACFEGLTGSADVAVREAATYYLAQVLGQKGETAKALELLAKLAAEPLDAQHPFRAFARFARGAMLQQQGDFAGAETAYSQICAAPDAPTVIREEAMYRFAEVAFLRSAFAPAIVRFDQVLAAFPDGAWSGAARKHRAWAAFYAKEYRKAGEYVADWRRHQGEGSRGDDMDYLAGVSLLGSNQYEQALGVFRELKARPGISSEYRRLASYQIVYCLLALDKCAEVRQEASAFIAEYPKAPECADLHYFSGEAAFRLGDMATAVPELRQALDLAVGGWVFLEGAASRLKECLQRQGKPKEAAAVYRRLAGREGAANRAEMLLRAGELERAAGDLAAAAADFQRLRESFAAAPECRAATLYLGEIYAQQQQFDKADALVHELMKTSTPADQAGVEVFSGYLLYLQKKYGDAETVFRRAAGLPGADPKTVAEARYYLAAVLLELNREAEAVELFAALLKLPEAVRPYFSESVLARLEPIVYRNGALDVSETICRQLLASTTPGTADRARLKLVRVLLARNQAAEANLILAELLKKLDERKADADSAFREEALSVAGEVYLGQGDTDRAVTAFQQCLGKEGATGEAVVRARWGLAQIFFQEKRLNQALQMAVSAFVLGDDPIYTPRAMFLAVQILLAQGKEAEAQTTWLELNTRFPAFAESRKDDPAVTRLPRGKKSPAPPPAGR